MDASKDEKNKISILEATHYTVSAWRQVTQQTLEYCFRKAGYECCQPSDVSDIAVRSEDGDDAFCDWQKFSGVDNETFNNYMSVDSYLATSGVNTVNELCKSHVGTLNVEGEEEEGEIVNPNPKSCQSARSARESQIIGLCAQQQRW
jgi:hypothetical protein